MSGYRIGRFRKKDATRSAPYFLYLSFINPRILNPKSNTPTIIVNVYRGTAKNVANNHRPFWPTFNMKVIVNE